MVISKEESNSLPVTDLLRTILLWIKHFQQLCTIVGCAFYIKCIYLSGI